jgi:hypothetical protein
MDVRVRVWDDKAGICNWLSTPQDLSIGPRQFQPYLSLFALIKGRRKFMQSDLSTVQL